MAKNYIEELRIDAVRHLQDITISFSEKKPHLILTGRNGSGKTTLIRAIEYALVHTFYKDEESSTTERMDGMAPRLQIGWKNGVQTLQDAVVRGRFLLACYDAERAYSAANVQHAEKMQLKDSYTFYEHPGKEFVKYLVDYKMKEALYRGNGQQEQADNIRSWFDRFTEVLRRVFGDPDLTLSFDIETFAFYVREPGKEPFSFNELSSGYAAVLDIVTDLMIRMEKQHHGTYDLPGIVLIDEVEAHLHLSLQKEVLPILMGLFPQIQFIVTTHSPFVLGSVRDAVIYDLENQTLVQDSDGLFNLPYSGIVEGYFRTPELSRDLQDKFSRFKELAQKERLTDDDFEELGTLETYLDEIPDYLAVNVMADYQQLKLQMEERLEAEGGHGQV